MDNLAPRQFIPPADIALYATVTGLACFSRSTLRTRVLENPNLRPFLDLEPYLRDVARAFYDNKFKTGLDLLNQYRVRVVPQRFSCRTLDADRARHRICLPPGSP